MAKAAKQSAAVSFDPDNMSSGLKDDFRGVIREAVYGPWDYDGNIQEPVLGVRLTIEEEGQEEPVVQWWSAGDINSFAPSKDGIEPADEDDPFGPYAVKVGSRTALSGSTNFAHLMKSIIDCGAASGTFTRDNLTNSLECLVGIDAQWNRVPQQKRSGAMPGQGEGRKNNDVLVVTEIFAYGDEEPKKGAKKPATKPTGKPAPKAKEEEPEAEDAELSPLDQEITDVLTEALAEGPIKKNKLAALVLKGMGKSPNKAKAVKRVTEEDFLSGSAIWTYDEDSGTLSIE